MPAPRLQVSFIFPYRWIDDVEDRKHLSANLIKSINKGTLKQVYQSSSTDRYFADASNNFISTYMVRLKTHAYQPVKIKLTKSQLEKALQPAFPQAKLVAFETFFVQNGNGGLPMMELELYY